MSARCPHRLWGDEDGLLCTEDGAVEHGHTYTGTGGGADAEKPGDPDD